MSHDNVVPFEGRPAIDRRGSPDKAFSSDPIAMDCPNCGAALGLRSACRECGAVLDPVAGGGRAARGRRGD